MKKIALIALFLSIFTIQGSIVANAAYFDILVAASKTMSNNMKDINKKTTTNNSTSKGKVNDTVVSVNNGASSARLAAINRIMSNNMKHITTTTSTTTNNSTCKGEVSGSGIYVRSSLDFFDADGNSLKNCISQLAPGTIVTVLDGGEKYFSQQGNMYMYHIKFKATDGTQKTGYAPACYIDLI